MYIVASFLDPFNGLCPAVVDIDYAAPAAADLLPDRIDLEFFWGEGFFVFSSFFFSFLFIESHPRFHIDFV